MNTVPNRQTLAGLTVEESLSWDLCNLCGDFGYIPDPDSSHVARGFYCGACCRGMDRTKGD